MLVLGSVALGAALVVGGGRAAVSNFSFGPFAGYVWRGHVTSVQGVWTVPPIQGGSPLGRASSWIGAQAPGAPGPFVQVGTNEEREASTAEPAHDVYYAFWSDVAHGFHPQILFSVQAGDHVSARLTLARARWTVAIRDTMSGAAVRFTTSDETHASFNEAVWFLEDITDAATAKPYPFPRLGTFRFQGLAVNSAAPSYADLYSQWMSVQHGSLGPSPVQADAFTVQKSDLSPAARRYLQIVLPENVAQNSYVPQMLRWTATTPSSQIAPASLTFANALADSVRLLAAAHWAPTIRQLLKIELRALRASLADIEAAQYLPPGDLPLWRSTAVRDLATGGAAAHTTRRALGAPELVPTPGVGDRGT